MLDNSIVALLNSCVCYVCRDCANIFQLLPVLWRPY